jgi:hypothetical protein
VSEQIKTAREIEAEENLLAANDCRLDRDAGPINSRRNVRIIDAGRRENENAREHAFRRKQQHGFSARKKKMDESEISRLILTLCEEA